MIRPHTYGVWGLVQSAACILPPSHFLLAALFVPCCGRAKPLPQCHGRNRASGTLCPASSPLVHRSHLEYLPRLTVRPMPVLPDASHMHQSTHGSCVGTGHVLSWPG